MRLVAWRRPRAGRWPRACRRPSAWVRTATKDDDVEMLEVLVALEAAADMEVKGELEGVPMRHNGGTSACEKSA